MLTQNHITYFLFINFSLKKQLGQPEQIHDTKGKSFEETQGTDQTYYNR